MDDPRSVTGTLSGPAAPRGSSLSAGPLFPSQPPSHGHGEMTCETPEPVLLVREVTRRVAPDPGLDSDTGLTGSAGPR